jgi:hypothetical protein
VEKSVILVGDFDGWQEDVGIEGMHHCGRLRNFSSPAKSRLLLLRIFQIRPQISDSVVVNQVVGRIGDPDFGFSSNGGLEAGEGFAVGKGGDEDKSGFGGGEEVR